MEAGTGRGKDKVWDPVIGTRRGGVKCQIQSSEPERWDPKWYEVEPCEGVSGEVLGASGQDGSGGGEGAESGWVGVRVEAGDKEEGGDSKEGGGGGSEGEALASWESETEGKSGQGEGAKAKLETQQLNLGHKAGFREW